MSRLKIIHFYGILYLPLLLFTMKTEYKHTVKDVAEMLNIKPETVRRWCREKKVKHLKLLGPKGAYRFSWEDIKALVASLNA